MILSMAGPMTRAGTETCFALNAMSGKTINSTRHIFGVTASS